MSEIAYKFQEFSDNQQQIYDRVAQHYAAYRELSQKSRAFRGGMHWKRIKGREYLYRYRDRFGQGRSLGPRSPQTEEVYAAFGRGRREIREQLRTQRRVLAEEARFCQAALLQRVPRLTANLLRRFEQHDLLGSHLTVVGATAIYAYEFAGGAFLGGPRKSARGWGLLAGPGTGLALAASQEMDFSAFLTLLRQADRSFATRPGEKFQAVNRRGYRVQVLPYGSPGLGKSRNHGHPPGGAATHDFSFLLASPKFSQVVIAADGFPVTMVVPDPRAFALHKLWLSRQEDRAPDKRSMDRAQAMAVTELILRFLPQYHFFSAELRLFPEEFVRRAEKSMEGLELALDLDIDY